MKSSESPEKRGFPFFITIIPKQEDMQDDYASGYCNQLQGSKGSAKGYGRGGESFDYIFMTDVIEGQTKSLYLDGYLTYEQAYLILFKFGM